MKITKLQLRESITRIKNGNIKTTLDKKLKPIVESILNEERAKLSTMLQMVINGDMVKIEGTKITKQQAEKLLNLYNSKLIEKDTFDNTKLDKIFSMLKDYGISI